VRLIDRLANLPSSEVALEASLQAHPKPGR
jgi:hypothetical protein